MTSEAITHVRYVDLPIPPQVVSGVSYYRHCSSEPAGYERHKQRNQQHLQAEGQASIGTGICIDLQRALRRCRARRCLGQSRHPVGVAGADPQQLE